MQVASSHFGSLLFLLNETLSTPESSIFLCDLKRLPFAGVGRQRVKEGGGGFSDYETSGVL